MKFIDLCCGVGGFHQALSNMGMQCVFASDIDKDCKDNYEENYDMKPHGDLTKLDISKIPSFDVLCAGFPCQPFSKAGFQNGFNDDRGNIFYDICKIIKYHRPKYIILENVKNLASHDNGHTWNVIKTNIEKLDYNTYLNPLILNTLYFGVPQSRDRVVILCKRKDLGELPKLPKIDKSLTKDTSLKTIIENTVNTTLSKKHVITQNVWNNFLSLLYDNGIQIPKFPIWTDWWDGDGEGTSITKYDSKISKQENDCLIFERKKQFYEKYKNVIDKNREFYHKHNTLLKDWLIQSREHKEWLGAVRKMEWQAGEELLYMHDVLWSARGSGVRTKKINYSPTLVAMTSMIPIYGPLSRHFTPRECARLQSFPDDYKLHKNDKIAYKQLGNAVNVEMIEKSARFLINNESLFT